MNDKELKQAIREVLLEQAVIDALAKGICESPENFWNKPVTDYNVTELATPLFRPIRPQPNQFAIEGGGDE